MYVFEINTMVCSCTDKTKVKVFSFSSSVLTFPSLFVAGRIKGLFFHFLCKGFSLVPETCTEAKQRPSFLDPAGQA